MKKFLSHIYKESNKIDEKLLIEHIKGINTIAFKAIHDKIFFEYRDLLEISIKLHDFGKYTDYFQDYLKTGNKHPKNWHFHSFIGAVTALNLLKENQNKALIAYFIIKSHHGNLDDIKNCYYTLYQNDGENISNRKKRLKGQHENLFPHLNIIEKELNIAIGEKIYGTDIPDLYKETKSLTDKGNIQNYYLINYLFSLLIEADKLDASRTTPHTRGSIPIHLVNDHILKLTNGKIDPEDLRNKVRQTVLTNLEDNKLLEQRLFTLTAPTGIGKTLTSLDFAIKLRDKLPNKPQIIYGLPFINIIEQAINVYDKVFGKDDAKVLAHYQYADAMGQQEKYDGNDGEKGYEQKLKTLDCWQCDIVITTFVQVLQTLIGNRNKMLKRFNHFAGSIIILDEVQTIRLGHQPLIGAALYYLTKFLDARIILMTATRPKIFELANKHILEVEGEKANPKELLKGYEQVFGEFERTAIIPLIYKNAVDEEDFLENYFSEKWKKNKSCLIVCNTVNRSIDVFNAIRSHMDDAELLNPVYYLSTNIVPCDRLYIIEKVKLDLKYRKNPILVSTQSIEAGVDLDFDMGFRDLGPIDSIVQVAGRINRNNDFNKRYSPLYIIRFINEKGISDCERIYDEITEQQSVKALRNTSNQFSIEIIESKYLKLVDEYYNLMTDKKTSFDSSIKFFESMRTLKYDGKKEDYPVSHFKVIEDKGYAISVFVELDDYSELIANEFKRLLKKEIQKEEFEKYKKEFHQRIIAIPHYLKKAEYLTSWAKKDGMYKLTEDIYLIPKNELSEFYDQITGFNRSNEDVKVVVMF